MALEMEAVVEVRLSCSAPAAVIDMESAALRNKPVLGSLPKVKLGKRAAPGWA